MNAHWEAANFELPRLPGKLAWYLAVDTAALPPHDSLPPGKETILPDQTERLLHERSVVILLAR